MRKWGSQGSGTNQLNQPGAIAISKSADVFVTDGPNNRIVRTKADGSAPVPLGVLGSGGGWELNNPQGVAVTSEGDILVVDTYNHRVKRFDSTGSHLATWGRLGSGMSELNTPWGIAVDADDLIYVVS